MNFLTLIESHRYNPENVLMVRQANARLLSIADLTLKPLTNDCE